MARASLPDRPCRTVTALAWRRRYRRRCDFAVARLLVALAYPRSVTLSPLIEELSDGSDTGGLLGPARSGRPRFLPGGAVRRYRCLTHVWAPSSNSRATPAIRAAIATAVLVTLMDCITLRTVQPPSYPPLQGRVMTESSSSRVRSFSRSASNSFASVGVNPSSMDW